MKRKHRFLAMLSALALLMPHISAIPVQFASAADDTQDDWLHVEGDRICDMNGNEVWLTGVNWFGYNVGSQVFDGVWSVNMHDCLRLIADHGFNLLRVPMSTEIMLQWKNNEPDSMIKVNTYSNPELTLEGIEGGTVMYSFDIWNLAVQWCKELGIKIMIDVHSASTNAAGHQWALWYDDKFSTEDWIEGLTWMTEYYKNDDTIIAFDLENEPHGKKDEGNFAKWDDSTDLNNWKYAAERCAAEILAINPHVLIMVEGIESYPKFDEGADWNSVSSDYTRPPYPYSNYYGAWWGANFRGVRDYPIDLGKFQSQLVYSPHDYGPEVYKQEWFYLNDDSKTFSRQTLLDDYWYDTWAFIAEEHIAPLLMGEWGGWVDEEHDLTGENVHWLQEIRDYMIDKHIHHTFWCFNENSSDTGGLVYDNFGTWDDVKYDFIKSALWQDQNGVFISLDHQYPIGANGQSLSDYYGGSVSTGSGSTATTTSTTTTTTVTDDTFVMYGDLDENGIINTADAILLCRAIAGVDGLHLTVQGRINGDCDGITGLDQRDLVLLLGFIAGKYTFDQLGKPQT